MSEYDSREVFATRKQNVTLTFNMKDQQEREIYEWCSKQTDTSSDFIIKVLSQYKEYREFVQTVSKLHEMLPMLQKILPTEVSSSSNPLGSLLQGAASQQQMTMQSPDVTPVQQMSTQSTQATVTATVNSTFTPPTQPEQETMPPRSVRHGSSKRKRTSMPME